MLNFKIPNSSTSILIKRLQQMVTMDQMKNVMMGLGNIMGSANGKLSMKDFTNSMKRGWGYHQRFAEQ